MTDADAIPIPSGCGDDAVDTERRLIASCLHGGEVFDAAAETIRESDFLAPHHSAVWRSMAAVRADGPAFDLGAVCGRLLAAESAYRAEFDPNPQSWLWNCTNEIEPTGASWGFYAARVRDASLLRRLRYAANEILFDAEHPAGPAEEVVAAAERKLFDLARGDHGHSPVVARELVKEALNRIEERVASGGKVNGLETGLGDLDRYLAGLKPGQVVVIAARPGGGKTSLALNLAVHVTREYGPALFFSLEMTRAELADRMLALGSGVPVSRINKGRLETEHIDAIAAQAASDGIAGLPLWVDDDPTIGADRMLSTSRRAVRRHSTRLIVVDYLQLIAPENPRDNRTQQVGLLARRMKKLARECGVPLLLLSQLNREVESRSSGEPMLADLRESGEIEQHADAVVMLWPEANQPEGAETWTIRAKVAKNRGGPTGKLALAYRRPVMQFENHAPGVPQ